MRRRDFLRLGTIAAATGAFQIQVRAQQARTRRLAWLTNGADTSPFAVANRPRFLETLRKHGWSEQANLTIDYRYNAGTPEIADKLAAELIGLQPDVIFTWTTPPTNAIAARTSTIPIVFGYVSGTTIAPRVQSYAHPGGNITGFLYAPDEEYFGKAIDVLKEMTPNISGIATVLNPDAVPGGEGAFLGAFGRLVANAGLRLTIYRVRTPSEIASAFQAIASDRTVGVAVWGDAYLGQVDIRPITIEEARKNGLAVIWGQQQWATQGGIMAYAPDPFPIYLGAAEYIGLVLNGARPADLPIQTTPMALTVNLKAAREQGIVIPTNVLARADQVIE